MKLDSLLEALQTKRIDGSPERDITSLAFDSRLVEPGALFIAMPGAKSDGAEFIPSALAKGAAAIICEQETAVEGATRIVVPDARRALADVAAAYYGHPDRSMKMAGITGTNGKTTTAFLLKHICEQVLLRCGLIGTVRYEIADQVLPATRTTPESLEVQELLWRMQSAGCRSAVMEVSSHALELHRVRGIEWDTAVFTNLTQDHLDYHRTMEAYFEAKAKLFTGLAAQQHKTGTAVINGDDRYGAMLAQRLSMGSTRVITYGMGARSDVRASNVRTDFQGTVYQLDAGGRQFLVRVPQIGAFNVYNSLAAIGGAQAMGIEPRDAVLALATAPAVPGRMEAVPGQRNFKIFVDYAHTDDALSNALRTLRELKPARLIAVFGCGGDRDRAKRPRMGAAVNEHADYAIVTSDNPRSEQPEAIIEDIKPGLTRIPFLVIVDRRAAIERAVEIAGPRDIVLIAGKGHETYQEFKSHTLPFDDVAIARAAMDDKGSEAAR